MEHCKFWNSAESFIRATNQIIKGEVAQVIQKNREMKYCHSVKIDNYRERYDYFKVSLETTTASLNLLVEGTVKEIRKEEQYWKTLIFWFF